MQNLDLGGSILAPIMAISLEPSAFGKKQVRRKRCKIRVFDLFQTNICASRASGCVSMDSFHKQTAKVTPEAPPQASEIRKTGSQGFAETRVFWFPIHCWKEMSK